MTQRFLFILLILLLTSCHRHFNDRLETILAYSGGNRPELEKVIDHYTQHPGDSLKLKAALFLIENMPAHYAYGGKFMDDYISRIHAHKEYSYPIKKLVITLPFDDPTYRNQLVKQEDLKHITSDFLIHHIESAFRQWESLPWLEDLDFGTFCEYLLPYRMGNEPLDFWRDSIAFYEKDLTEFIKYYDDFQSSIYSIHRKYYNLFPNLNTLIPEEPLKVQSLECILLSRLDLFTFRTLGLPSAIDFIPDFGNHNGRHYWAALIDPNLKPLRCPQLDLYGIGKIYRKTYSHNPTIKAIGKEYIPPFFRDPFNKDVTDLYLQTADITLNIPAGQSISHAYLAIFNDLTWKSIASGKVEKGRVDFPKLGKNILYLPVSYDQEGHMSPLSSPFILQLDGKLRFIDADTNQRQSLCLTRKYPYAHSFFFWAHELLDCYFEASDHADFHSSTLVHRITREASYQYEKYPIDTTLKARYWRFVNQDRRFCQLSELRFIHAKGQEIQGKIIGTKPSDAPVLYDKDPLTTMSVTGWTGMDFSQPVSISEIQLLARSDANGIFAGNVYELLYYHYPEGWVSLGTQTATSDSLIFEQVPSNGLYWLQNLTTGKEERPFTWEKGRAQFW